MCVFWGWSPSSPCQVCLCGIPGCSCRWVTARPAPRSASLAVWQAWSPENGSCNPKKVTVCVCVFLLFFLEVRRVEKTVTRCVGCFLWDIRGVCTLCTAALWWESHAWEPWELARVPRSLVPSKRRGPLGGCLCGVGGRLSKFGRKLPWTTALFTSLL